MSVRGTGVAVGFAVLVGASVGDGVLLGGIGVSEGSGVAVGADVSVGLGVLDNGGVAVRLLSAQLATREKETKAARMQIRFFIS